MALAIGVNVKLVLSPEIAALKSPRLVTVWFIAYSVMKAVVPSSTTMTSDI